MHSIVTLGDNSDSESQTSNVKSKLIIDCTLLCTLLSHKPCTLRRSLNLVNHVERRAHDRTSRRWCCSCSEYSRCSAWHRLLQADRQTKTARSSLEGARHVHLPLWQMCTYLPQPEANLPCPVLLLLLQTTPPMVPGKRLSARGVHGASECSLPAQCGHRTQRRSSADTAP